MQICSAHLHIKSGGRANVQHSPPLPPFWEGAIYAEQSIPVRDTAGQCNAQNPALACIRAFFRMKPQFADQKFRPKTTCPANPDFCEAFRNHSENLGTTLHGRNGTVHLASA